MRDDGGHGLCGLAHLRSPRWRKSQSRRRSPGAPRLDSRRNSRGGRSDSIRRKLGGAAFSVTVRLQEATEGVRPGMAAEVAFRLRSGEGREQIVVPPFAVGEDQDGRFVFVVEEAGQGEGLVHRRGVRVGDLTADGLYDLH